MPYYPDGSIQHALQTGRRYSVREVIRLTLLMEGGNRTVLSDFGAAARMDESGRVGAIVGTLWYMAPEFFTRGYLEANADLCAGGLVLLELLGGAFPYDTLDRAAADARLRSGKHALRGRVGMRDEECGKTSGPNLHGEGHHPYPAAHSPAC